ncbi:MAG: cysteine--tRNA ligase [Acidimicrobiia bacterium]|nr:cysteine--tRNA ligase [Acidimicrobiia bacterium]
MIQVYNTLGRARVPLEPREPGKVSLYVCGPTVQSAPHVGHGRSAVAFDVIRRYLAWSGYEVTFVRNVTDVEDKIIAAANELGVDPSVHATRVAVSFAAAFEALGVLDPDVEPKATEHIAEMLGLISRLIERGLAYPAPNGDVYFSVRTLESYGKLSGRDPDELRSGARIEISEAKQDPLDFALWKAAKPGEPAWESPWGSGRPGWHIECSAMAEKYLGPSFDVHGGGSDLIFPHHENEIAQSEGVSGEVFARYWLHNGMVNLGGEKMAKSTGHVIDLASAIERFGGPAVRLFYLRAHYRSPLEFSEDLLEDARASLDRVARLMARASAGDAEPEPTVMWAFANAMDDDFATPEGLGVLFDAVRDSNRALDSGEDASGLLAAVAEILGVLGLEAEVSEDLSDLGAEVDSLLTSLGLQAGGTVAVNLDAVVAARRQARDERNWPRADEIRDRLAGMGIVVEDGADGSRWHRR